MKKKNCKNRFVASPAKALCTRPPATKPRLQTLNNGFALISTCMLIPVIMSAVALTYASYFRLVLTDQATSDCLLDALDQLENLPVSVNQQKVTLSRVIESVHLTLNGYEIFKERKLECGAEFINQNGSRHYYLIPAKS